MLKKLASIPHDKLLHFFYGSVLASVSMLALGLFASVALVVLVATGKEVYDEYNKGTVDVYDAVWTVLGGVVVWLPKIGGII